MKLIILPLLLATATCMPYGQDNQDHATHQHHGDHADGHDSDSDNHLRALPISKVYGKAKKVPGSSSSFAKSDFCPLGCLFKMNQDVAATPELKEFTTKQTLPYRFDGLFNKQMLTQYCQVMNQTKACIRPCDESPSKQVAERALLTPNYLCVDTKYIEYSPCYAKVTKVNEKLCHADNKCGGKKTAVQNAIASRPVSMSDIETLLQHFRYFICYNDCDRPKMTQECGADATRVLEGMYKHSINSMEQLFIQMGLQITVPSVCSQLGVHDD